MPGIKNSPQNRPTERAPVYYRAEKPLKKGNLPAIDQTNNNAEGIEEIKEVKSR